MALAEPLAAAPGPMVPVSCRVRSTRRDTADTWTLELDPPGGAFAFAPGQFTMLSAFGAGEVPISISGDPDAPGTLVHTVRAVGAATRAICAAQAGDVLTVRGPFGSAWPVTDEPADPGRDVVVITGGIGLAPLRPAILRLLARAAGRGRLLLLYGGRAPDQLLYPDELDRWRERGLDVTTTVDGAGPEWLGHVGVVPKLVRRAAFDGERAVALVCGPEVMMRFTLTALERCGVTADRVHLSVERNMQCGIGHCGHCQLGPTLVCRDGPVYRADHLARWLAVREL
jgi:NAD(P)H-flavin reductase